MKPLRHKLQPFIQTGPPVTKFVTSVTNPVFVRNTQIAHFYISGCITFIQKIIIATVSPATYCAELYYNYTFIANIVFYSEIETKNIK